MDNSTQNNINAGTIDTPVSNIPQAQPSEPSKKPTGLIAGMVLCLILAVAGIGFGVYSFMDSGKKDQQISELKTKVNNKDSEISELEEKVSTLELKTINSTSVADSASTDTTSTTTETKGGTAAVTLGGVIEDNESRTVYKIGECTSDAPSTKCPVEVNGKQGLISHLDTEGFLRLVIPKE
jgi:hypothetical protein